MTYLGVLKTAGIGFGIGHGHMPYTSAFQSARIGTAYASAFKSAGWEGIASDSRIIKSALTRNDNLKIPLGKYYLVHAGYMNRGRLIAPYSGVCYHLKEYSSRPLENAKELFNLRHVSLRNAIERAFGVLKKKFPIIAIFLENFEIEDDQRSLEINVVRSRVSSQDGMSSKSKKRRLAEDDELGNVISQSFDNVSMEIDKVTEVMAKCFPESYGAEFLVTLGVLDLDPISKIETYIFFMENPTYKEMFFGCPDHECKCVLLTLMSKSKN
ncbi:hypothetical protein SO802_018620 [Lithocarpus litseifolius]|uniref:DDE Tnp4 domain-containing protein n=1 Tax=Lithocarpus litseifolius TaxID=425828 RepID=A0AAW2CNN8_9ROSI